MQLNRTLLTNEQDFVGKTVKAVDIDSDTIYLVFDDNSFAILESNDVSIGYQESQYNIKTLEDYHLTDTTLYALGVVSEKEYTKAVEEREEEYRKEQELRTKMYEERDKQRELELLATLKKKYE